MLLALVFSLLLGVGYGLVESPVYVVHRADLDPGHFQQWSDHVAGLRLEFVSIASPSWGEVLAGVESGQISNIVLLGLESNRLSGVLSPVSLGSRVQSGLNLVVAIDHQSVGQQYHQLAKLLNINQPITTIPIVDHFNKVNNLDSAIDFNLNNHLGPIIDNSKLNPNLRLAFSGIPHATNRSPLVTPVGYAKAQAAVHADDPTSPSAGVINLVSAVQLKNNNRVIWSGSVDLFTDNYTTGTNNQEFVSQLTSWAFQQTGILKIQNASHQRLHDKQTSSLYKVNDLLRYTVNLTTLSNGQVEPFVVEDGQFEFTMLDPHLRQAISPAEHDSTAISATFAAPDRHGVFTLSFDYRRTGYSFVSHQTLVSVTPPRHDQFDRFITGAGPFYLGALSVTIATTSFIALWSSL